MADNVHASGDPLAAERGAGEGIARDIGGNAMDLAALARIEDLLLWLASQMIHNANHVRVARDGLKVGGHQASSASMVTVMTALFMGFLRPQDRVAVKPHAGPVLHALEYLFGRQSLDQLQRFRGFGGAQAYPSRTKDRIGVDFSTGSVGLGVAITAFASLVQDFWAARDRVAPSEMGRFIALMGDAELDEGNIYEALIEGYKHDLRNVWWIVDYNRQSLDSITPERMWDRFDDVFDTMGWRVENLKFGAAQRAAFAEPGAGALRNFIETCPNDLYSALAFEGASAWRAELKSAFRGDRKALAWLGKQDDDRLEGLMTRLGGHCPETLLAAFARASQHEQPTLFIAYTIKGYRLPFQGHKDNHSGLMNPGQMRVLQEKLAIPEGAEWDPLVALPAGEQARIRTALENSLWADAGPRDRGFPSVATPAFEEFPGGDGKPTSTQAAFGRILTALAKREDEFGRALITTSPDVTVSTNLGGFVSRRGLFARAGHPDLFRERRIASPHLWTASPTGQHFELGIAENNLFLMLAAAGLSGPLFGQALFPVGTLYDPFIARGLDALNYALYQNARFILVATPSGVTLGPEGGAHQSVSAPLIGMGQPGLKSYEPAFADELTAILADGFGQLHRPEGESLYLRLSTRSLAQPVRGEDDAWHKGAIAGAYWRVPPAAGSDYVLAYCGVLAPEAEQAFAALREDFPGAGLLAITSPGQLFRGWTAACRARQSNGDRSAHIEDLLAPVGRAAQIVTLIDGAPATLAWLGSVRGHVVRALGVENFGQSGDLPDLYAKYGLDSEAIIAACAEMWVSGRRGI